MWEYFEFQLPEDGTEVEINSLVAKKYGFAPYTNTVQGVIRISLSFLYERKWELSLKQGLVYRGEAN